jgi:hypothetical protein
MYRRAEGCQRHAASPRTNAPLLALCALIAALIPLYGGTARACSCLQQTPAEAYEQAVSVFEGHVLEITPAPAGDEHALPQLAVKLAVVRAWKGMEQEQVVVTTAGDSAMCGYAFELDKDYLVYAGSSAKGLSVSLCSRTAPVAAADEDLRLLGMGATPVEPRLPKAEADALKTPKPEPPARGGCASCTVQPARGAGEHALALTAGIAALVSARMTRRRNARR